MSSCSFDDEKVIDFHIHRLCPPAGASLQLVPNSEFTIQIPFALFRVLYRLKKHLSLWWRKENSEAILLYCID